MRFALILFASNLFAALNLQVTGATATQVVATWNSADAACVIAISEGATIGALVPDVDPTLFSGSNLANRTGEVAAFHGYHQFVGGKQLVAKASDNRYHSRALQNNTAHALRATCSDGTQTVQFSTGNLLATTFTWPTAMADPANPGVEAIPTIDWSDRNWSAIDPLTGTKYRAMGFIKQEQMGGTGEKPFAYSAGANWVNPSNALALDGSFATYSTVGQDILCVRSNWGDDLFDPGKQVGGITFMLTGKVDNTSTGTQKDMEIAMSTDGCQTFVGPWQSGTLPLASAYAPPGTDVNVGDDKTSPVPIVASWITPGNDPPTVLDMQMRRGTVNTSGTAVAYTAPGGNGGPVFPFSWGAGTPIEIDTGGGYLPFTLASLTSAFDVTLNTSAGTHTNVPFRAPTFSFGIRPKVAAARTISLDYVRMYVNLYAGLRANGGDGMSTQCSMNPTPEAAVITAATNASPIQITISTAQSWITGDTIIVAGVQGNTAANRTGLVHRIDSTHFTLDGSTGNGTFTKRGIAYPPNARTGYQCAAITSLPGDWQYTWTATSDGSGETHSLGPLRVSGTIGSDTFQDICGGSTISWNWISDPVFPTVYCITPDIVHPTRSLLLSATYTGSPAHGFNGDQGALPNGGNADTYASWDVAVLSSDLNAAYHAFDARYDASVFTPGTVDGFQDGRVTILTRAGTQDTMGWRIVFDPATHAVTGMMPSFLQLPAAYCSIHTANTNTFNPWITTTLKNLIFEGGGSYNGPYFSAITSNGGAGTGSVSATLQDCATAVTAIGQTNVLGVTGTHCSTISVATEPITPGSVTPANSILMPVPIGQPMQFEPTVTFDGNLSGERIRVIAKSGLTWVIQRGYYSQDGSPPPPAAQPAGSLLEPLCGALTYQILPPLNQDCCLVHWNHRDDPHALNPGDPYAQQGGDGTSTAYPLDLNPAKQIAVTATMRKEDTFARLGHFAMGAAPDQSTCDTLNDNGNNNFNPADSTGYPSAFWQSIAIRSGACAPNQFTNYRSSAIGITAPFSGVFGDCIGNIGDIHPSTNYTTDQSLMYAAHPCGASPGFPGTITPQGAQRYKVTGFLPGGFAALDLKRNQLLVQVGHGSAVNVSGPGCAIGTTSSDAWKWGLVYKANECVAGSVPGEVYVNAPGVTPGPVGSFIAGIYTAFDKVAPYTLARDIVVMLAGSLSDNYVQYRTTGQQDIAGNRARKLGTLLSGTKAMQRTANYRPFADGTWAWSATQTEINGPWTTLAIKTPPFPPDSTVNRATYVPIPIALKPPAALSVDNAIVEFGYNSSLDCVNRTGESCIAAPSQDPYFYSVADAPVTGVACSTGCTLTINAVPGTVVFWRRRYRDVSNATLDLGPITEIAVP